MPDPSLHGNGYPCPACELRRDEKRAAGAMDQRVTCNLCGETGRIALTAAEIVERQAEEARREYWPRKEWA